MQKKAFDKIQHPFIIKKKKKPLQIVGTEGTHFDTIKPTYDKLTVNNILNREELKSFPL